MRRLPLILLALPLLAGASAFAADLALSSDGVGAGQAVVSACGDTAAAAVTYTTTPDATVAQIDISGLPATCEDAAVLAHLVDGDGQGVGTGGQGTVADGGTATVALPEPRATVAQTADARFVLVGPVAP